jgi:Protein of unknown function (DUF1569)
VVKEVNVRKRWAKKVHFFSKPNLLYLYKNLLVKNLYETTAYNEIITRMNQLTPSNEKLWGKMNVAQMLAHCKEAFKVPLSEKPLKRLLIGYIFGGIAKKQLYSDKPWKQNLPTAPNFKITNERDFNTEKQELQKLIEQFYTLGPDKTGKYLHPFFGRLTKEQWGIGMYKHVDHHLQQFGV